MSPGCSLQTIRIKAHLDFKVRITRQQKILCEICVYKTRLNLTLWEKTNLVLLKTETIHTWLKALTKHYAHPFLVLSCAWLYFSYKLSSQRPLTTDCSGLCVAHRSSKREEHLLNLTLSYKRVSLALCWILNYLQTALLQFFLVWLHTLSQPDISIMFKYICWMIQVKGKYNIQLIYNYIMLYLYIHISRCNLIYKSY